MPEAADPHRRPGEGAAVPRGRGDASAAEGVRDDPGHGSRGAAEETRGEAVGEVDDASSQEDRGQEDALWVDECLSGDPRGFEKLVEKYQRQAVVVSYRLLGNHDDARDVSQDAFVKAFRSLDTLERPGAFGGWLMRIVTNLSLNYRRGRSLRMAQPLENAFAESPGGPGEKPMRGHGSDSLAQSDDPQRAAEGRELGHALQEALAKLPEKQRQALMLFTIQEMPQKEVAETLDCSVEAVKWHVFQGRKRLRELLKDTM